MNTSIWCCVWGGNCQCASGTLGSHLGSHSFPSWHPVITGVKTIITCSLQKCSQDVWTVAPKAYGYLKNCRAAVNGLENVCEQSSRLASGRFPGSWTPWVPPGLLLVLHPSSWRCLEVSTLLSVGCEKVGIGSERPPSSATERPVCKTDLLHEGGPQCKKGQGPASHIEMLLGKQVLLSDISMFRPSFSTWDTSLFPLPLSWTRPNQGHLWILLPFLCLIFSPPSSCRKHFPLAASQRALPVALMHGACVLGNGLGAALALTLRQAPHPGRLVSSACSHCQGITPVYHRNKAGTSHGGSIQEHSDLNKD